MFGALMLSNIAIKMQYFFSVFVDLLPS